jgi:hypothetical protein
LTILSDRPQSVGIAFRRLFEGTDEELDIAEVLFGFKDQQAEEALWPFNAHAVGFGLDEDGPYMAVALVHDSPALAENNVAQLARRIDAGANLEAGLLWSNLIDEVEVRADGRVLLATLRGSITGDWIDIALTESLLWHSGPDSID